MILRFLTILILLLYAVWSKSFQMDVDKVLSHVENLKLKNLFHLQQFEDFYHTVQKRDLSTQMDGVHASDAYFSLEFENKTLLIDLSLNHELLPDSFAVTTYTKKGSPEVYKPIGRERNHCYYQGRVRGINGSKVIANTCEGLKGSIILPDEILIIEPYKNGSHFVYRADNFANEQKEICAYDNITHTPKSVFQNHTYFYSEITKFRKAFLKQSSNSEKKFVELLVIADNAAFQKYGTKTAVEAHVKEIVNYVDGFYRELDVRVILSHIEVWNNGDQITVSSDAEATLHHVAEYRGTQLDTQPPDSPWQYTDTVHLLHGGDLDGSTLGVAFVGGMCRLNSVGVDQDSRTTINVASTITHEMGHSFGMEHDGEECYCPEGKECIMSASTSFTKPMAWSSCSSVALEQNLRLGIGNCLYNVPDTSRIVGGPKCGNDIVEQGEECDCGFPEQCESQCCNPSTCQLEPGAVCDAGLCCENCQLVRVGVTCRVSVSECDLPEYCSGNAPHHGTTCNPRPFGAARSSPRHLIACPHNVFKEDGTRCEKNMAACSGGVCLTHDMLCESAWGDGGSAAPDICYNVLNVLGTKHGNCGHDKDGSYVKCAAEDVKCGKLYCTGGEKFPLIGSLAVRVTIEKSFNCKGIGSNSNKTEPMDPGMVRSGTTCDADKVCKDAMCQSIPPLTCTQKCNGNGVCNNFGNCHCNDGYAPPYCNSTGRGGSLDSGLYSENTVSASPPFATTIQSTTTRQSSTLSSSGASDASDRDVEIREGQIGDNDSDFSTEEVILVVLSSLATVTATVLILIVSVKLYHGKLRPIFKKSSSRYVDNGAKDNKQERVKTSESKTSRSSIKSANAHRRSSALYSQTQSAYYSDLSTLSSDESSSRLSSKPNRSKIQQYGKQHIAQNLPVRSVEKSVSRSVSRSTQAKPAEKSEKKWNRKYPQAKSLDRKLESTKQFLKSKFPIKKPENFGNKSAIGKSIDKKTNISLPKPTGKKVNMPLHQFPGKKANIPLPEASKYAPTSTRRS